MLYSSRYGASSSSLLAYMNLHTRLKRNMAGLVRWRPSRWLLRLAVRLFAPQHRVGVSVIVINTDQQILLLKHVYHPTLPWGPPGGWLDKGEDPRTGAARELREETGITAEIGPLLLLEHQTPPDHIGIAYLAQLPSPSPTAPFQLSHEIITAEWFTAASLPPISSFTRRAIALALLKKGQSTKDEGR